MCLKANYLDHLMLLPSYPLYLWKVSHTSTVEVEQPGRAVQFHPALIVVSPLNALDQIDAKNITMLLEKCIAFSK